MNEEIAMVGWTYEKDSSKYANKTETKGLCSSPIKLTKIKSNADTQCWWDWKEFE